MQTRTIKFRAWDKITDQMYNWNDIYSIHRGFKLEGDNNYSDIKLTCSMPDGSGFKPYDFELMQYTGLKDKNGVEIYEKDVVSYSEHYIGDHRYSAGRGVVEFDNGSFFINESEFSPELCREEIENEHIEIIGNIYENPELVDKESM